MRHAIACSRPLYAAIAILAGATGAPAQNTPEDAARNRKELEDLVRQNAELQRKIEDLHRRINAPQPTGQAQPPAQPPTPPTDKAANDALDRAVADLPSRPALQRPDASKDLASFKYGSATLRFIDVSMDALFAVGASTEDDQSLQSLQGGGHDPRKRGFTVQNVELSFTGAVDPYFDAEAHIVAFIEPLSGESVFELEEVFARSQSLPGGLQAKVGHYFTEFGLINPQHPHQWHWMDQPVINTRLFGPDGMRGTGARLAWLTPLPWYSQISFGVQNANGETMASFLASEEFFGERPVGGRPFMDRDVATLGDLTYLLRWENSWELSPETTAKVGASGLFGPNATGTEGETRIYGADLKLKWRPAANQRDWPFVLWESEIMARDYDADAFFDDSDPANVIDLPAETLRDWGFYTQVLYGFAPRWAAGLRYEYATGSGDSVGGRENDAFRDDRQRISPLLTWQVSEFSRLRLQYNYDLADHLTGGDAHSVYLGLEVFFGAHPAHTY